MCPFFSVSILSLDGEYLFWWQQPRQWPLLTNFISKFYENHHFALNYHRNWYWWKIKVVSLFWYLFYYWMGSTCFDDNSLGNYHWHFNKFTLLVWIQSYTLLLDCWRTKINTYCSKKIFYFIIRASKIIPATHNKKNFQNPTGKSWRLGIMATLAFSCQKNILQSSHTQPSQMLASFTRKISILLDFNWIISTFIYFVTQ